MVPFLRSVACACTMRAHVCVSLPSVLCKQRPRFSVSDITAHSVQQCC